MWQEVIVGICVLVALVFVLRKYVFKDRPASGSCDGCNNGCGRQDKRCSK